MGSLPKSVPEELISVDAHAAYDLINTGKHRYLDVRTVEEFSKAHPVEDAINIPYMFFTPEGRIKNPKFLEEAASVLNKDEHIVVGCQSGVRSLHAAVDLLDTGFKHIKNMAGGYAMWVENGYLVKKHGETEVKHGEIEVKKHEETEVKKQEELK